MSRMTWDQTGEKLYETGVQEVALFKQDSDGAYGAGVPWNGFTNFTKKPTGAEATPLYANNKKYAELMSTEEFGFSMTAYMYPDEWAECDGSKEIAPGVTINQQDRASFGLALKTLIGNDTVGTSYGYTLSLVYGAKAKPSERAYNTVNDSPEAGELSWEGTTTPVEIPGFKPSASLDINSTKVDAEKLAALEAIIYGTEEAEPRLPLPNEVAELFKGAAAG